MTTPEAGALIVRYAVRRGSRRRTGLAQGGDIRPLRCGRLGATDDQKLIAAKAANDIFPARDGGESFADLHQKAVAARMAEPIVNGFETVEIDKMSATCCC